MASKKSKPKGKKKPVQQPKPEAMTPGVEAAATRLLERAQAAGKAEDDPALVDKLNKRQQAFVGYYCGECRFNASRAAEWAGYSPKTAGQIGHALLKKVEIQKAIKEELGKRATDHPALVRDIIEEYKKLAFSNIATVAEWNNLIVKLRNGEELPVEVQAAIKSIKVSDSGVNLELHDKRGALGDLAKIMGMLTDDFRVRPEKHENIVERLYRQRQEAKLKQQQEGAK